MTGCADGEDCPEMFHRYSIYRYRISMNAVQSTNCPILESSSLFPDAEFLARLIISMVISPASPAIMYIKRNILCSTSVFPFRLKQVVWCPADILAKQRWEVVGKPRLFCRVCCVCKFIFRVYDISGRWVQAIDHQGHLRLPDCTICNICVWYIWSKILKNTASEVCIRCGVNEQISVYLIKWSLF